MISPSVQQTVVLTICLSLPTRRQTRPGRSHWFPLAMLELTRLSESGCDCCSNFPAQYRAQLRYGSTCIPFCAGAAVDAPSFGVPSSGDPAGSWTSFCKEAIPCAVAQILTTASWCTDEEPVSRTPSTCVRDAAGWSSSERSGQPDAPFLMRPLRGSRHTGDGPALSRRL